MRSSDYPTDVLAGDWRRRRLVETIPAELDLVVEEAETGFCGAVVDADKERVTLEDRHGRRRVFPLLPAAFLLDGRPVTLAPPHKTTKTTTAPQRTASGSIAVTDHRARVALPSRIYVEGLHDAQLVEQVWGDDLRVEGVAVEPLHGVDDLAAIVRDFDPGPGRRLGVLVDHLVPGSKESRIVAQVRHPHVLVVGHPYVDIWQAVKPAALGIAEWPSIRKGEPWKEGIARSLGAADVHEMWRRVRSAVRSYTDLEPALLGRVEELIDFVTAG